MNKPNLLYIANVRLPTEKAHGVQITKMCEAFAGSGMEVTLLAPKRRLLKNTKVPNVFRYYQIKQNFKIVQLTHLDYIYLQHSIKNSYFASLIFLIQTASFSVRAFFYALSFDGVIYSRSLISCLLLSFFRKHVYFESHDFPSTNMIHKILAQKTDAVVGITKSIVKGWKDLGAQTFYSPDGVSDEFFSNTSKSTARKKLKLPLKEKLVVYTGNLYAWKGVETLFQAAKNLPEYQFYFVGGNQIDENRQRYETESKTDSQIHFMGPRPYKEIPLWLKAADVLVIPNSAKTEKGSKHTSPLKLFEYMASETPIVASKVPALTEILDESMTYFFKPDSDSDLQKTIAKAFQSSAQQKVTQAYQAALGYTWKSRAQKLVSDLFRN